MTQYPAAYSHESFWRKLRSAGRRAGGGVIERALVLYYCLQDDDTPRWARRVIAGALAYFIFPVDLIPDVVPFTGYTDDFVVLAAAIANVALHLKETHRAAARRKMADWFGSV